MRRLFCKHNWRVLHITRGVKWVRHEKAEGSYLSYEMDFTEALICCDKCGAEKIRVMDGE